jgi:hypothetical protein
VTPSGEAGRLCYILENHRSLVYESARGDWAFFLVVNRRERPCGRDATHAALRLFCRFDRLLRESLQT